MLIFNILRPQKFMYKNIYFFYYHIGNITIYNFEMFALLYNFYFFRQFIYYILSTTLSYY